MDISKFFDLTVNNENQTTTPPSQRSIPNYDPRRRCRLPSQSPPQPPSTTLNGYRAADSCSSSNPSSPRPSSDI